MIVFKSNEQHNTKVKANLQLLQYLDPYSPPEFCISHQYFGITVIFAELPYWQPGKDFRITVLELIEEVDVCVWVASFLQVHHVSPTWLRGVCFDDQVEVASDICQRQARCSFDALSRVNTDVCFTVACSTLQFGRVSCVQECSGGVCRGLVLPCATIWADNMWLKMHRDY